MATLRIHDIENHVLAVGLYDLLMLIAPRALDSDWVVSTVKDEASGQEWFEAAGDRAEYLEAVAQNDSVLSGRQMADAAMRAGQIIWGRFTAHSPGADSLWVMIQAIDSTFYEVTTDDQTVMSAIRKRYREIREVDGPYGSFPRMSDQDHS
ncbi:hypothetical protein [Rhizobium oryzicola]|uniref:Uncharacterized protein n=1 Tax=Rhizobium oryzicola TaxID=1232668 RepID=A0ABT8STL6_9HYPH|nr:hypothetical protein [Rhizobium oryzicola]MDO1581757.1 hypothetical protein [Rhizobium oryzicola]